MATLVLSTVGTLLGGPVGGAIGSLVGQSIDQQIFGSPRRGPRLGDLSVQTSSYGTQVPRIYGTMRVAGSIVWSTDLVESSVTSGAKGQPDETYSYSVSFAVALSSRRATGIKRIWADGKLLRGEAGDFKVPTEFRFYPGDEDQSIDPLIGSVEGNDSTPAFRGLALAVFENLELAEFGNRIPFLTFEVAADDDDLIAVAAILADASGGRIDCSSDALVAGYAAVGRSIRQVIEPLVEAFGFDLLDDGSMLRSPVATGPVQVFDDDVGSSPDTPVPRLERDQTPFRELPSRLSLSYYDPDRDYQTGQVEAQAGEQGGSEAVVELPAVLPSTDARALVEDRLARQWAARDKLVLRLPPRFLDLEPGTLFDVGLSPELWVLQSCVIDGFVSVCELRPLWRTLPSLSAEPGRASASADLTYGPLTLALIDIPDPTDAQQAATLHVAASSPSGGWKTVPIEVTAGGVRVASRTAARKAVIGETVDPLPAGQAELLDLGASVDVQLIDHDQWLTSCDDQALVDGANLSLIGNELVQFGEAQPVGPGRFRLSRLLRGRGGTDWAMPQHAAGETFVAIDPTALRQVRVPLWARGSDAVVTQQGGVASAAIAFECESIKPIPPVNVRADPGASGILVSWTRRSRAGWGWVDDIDAPVGEASELYSVTVIGPSGSLERRCGEPQLELAGSELSTLGTGLATISVRQIGDWAASRPAETSIILP